MAQFILTSPLLRYAMGTRWMGHLVAAAAAAKGEEKKMARKAVNCLINIPLPAENWGPPGN